jgi:hypothetical protein
LGGGRDKRPRAAGGRHYQQDQIFKPQFWGAHLPNCSIVNPQTKINYENHNAAADGPVLDLELFNALQGYNLLRTDRNGSIELIPDGAQMWVEAER